MSKSVIETFVDAEAVETEFLEEFGDQLTDEQVDVLTSGFRAAVVEEIEDPSAIDPLKEPARAQAALKNIPRSSLVHAERPFVLPLVPYIKAAGMDAPPEVKVLSEKQDFYLLKFGLDATPHGKERFGDIEVKYDYPDQKGLMTHSMTPNTQLEERFSAHAAVSIGIDPSLSFCVPMMETGVSSVGGTAKVDVGVMYKWEYKPLKATIVTKGEKSSFASWQFKNPARMVGSVELATILAVPKGCSKLSYRVEGSYEVDRHILWWKRSTKIVMRSPGLITVELR